MGQLSSRRWAPRALLLLVALACAACGGSSPRTSSSLPVPPTRATETVSPQPAGPTPSASAKLICSAEVQGDLAYTLGEKPIAAVRPTWVDHLYSCDYRYRQGVIALSVQELSSQAQTLAYYDGIARRLGDTGSIPDLGQGAYSTRDGSVVVRKDWRVLFVDVSKLPAQFGSPPTSSADVAVTVAEVVIACWNGD
jgi:hypothetical protein